MREDVLKLLDNMILLLFENEYDLQFPINPAAIINKLYNCRVMTYNCLAETTGKTIQDIINVCHSSDGCTYYDKQKSRYLVLINTSGRNSQRVRWTTAHELGHIMAGHLTEITKSSSDVIENYMEEEADYFAASFLAPIAAIRRINVRDSEDIAYCFGLSQTAAAIRWAEYCRTSVSCKEIEEFFDKNRPKTPHKKYRFKTDHAILVAPKRPLDL